MFNARQTATTFRPHCLRRVQLILTGTAGALMAARQAAAETLATPKVSGLSGALPDAGASVFRVFGALILVVAIFLGGAWLFRNWQRFATRKSGGAKLNLIEARTLGPRQTLYVIGYQQQRMLLAATPAGVTLVSHLPEAAEVTEAAAAPAAGPTLSFAEAFQQVLARKS